MYSVICIRIVKTTVFNSEKLDVITKIKYGYFYAEILCNNLEQGLANCDPWAKLGLFLQIELYWDTTMLLSFCIVYGCFYIKWLKKNKSKINKWHENYRKFEFLYFSGMQLA